MTPLKLNSHWLAHVLGKGVDHWHGNEWRVRPYGITATRPTRLATFKTRKWSWHHSLKRDRRHA